MRRLARYAVAATIALAVMPVFTPARAAETAAYPVRPIRLVVPFAAGTQLDIAARGVGAKLAEALGQPVTIDDRPGASGNIASELVAKSPPDGHTLLVTGSFIANLPNVMGTNAVDPVASFAPVIMFGQPPMLVVANPALNVSSLPALVALARAAPGKIAYSTPGVGTGQHLAGALLCQRAGIDMLHVPYANANQALKDAVTGEVPVFFTYLGAVEPQLRNGQLKPLAVLTNQRTQAWPDVPTVAELGYRGFEIDSWNVLLAHAGTPREIVDLLNREMARIVELPDVREQFATMGMTPITSTPAQLAATIRSAVVRYEETARRAGIRPH